MQRNFGALFGPAPAALASTSRHFVAIEELSRADLPLVRCKSCVELLHAHTFIYPISRTPKILTAIPGSPSK
jgi:hypothetical protein